VPSLARRCRLRTNVANEFFVAALGLPLLAFAELHSRHCRVSFPFEGGSQPGEDSSVELLSLRSGQHKDKLDCNLNDH
jgi:hypothetical protein